MTTTVLYKSCIVMRVIQWDFKIIKQGLHETPRLGYPPLLYTMQITRTAHLEYSVADLAQLKHTGSLVLFRFRH